MPCTTASHHALGALHLMQEALDSLREKGIVITEDEYRGACMAILLHDVGHGPFSHALEHTLVRGVHHEEISTLIMTRPERRVQRHARYGDRHLQ